MMGNSQPSSVGCIKTHIVHYWWNGDSGLNGQWGHCIAATVVKCLFRPCWMLVYCGYLSLAVVTTQPTHSSIHMAKNCEEITTLRISHHDFLIHSCSGMHLLKGWLTLSDERELHIMYGWSFSWGLNFCRFCGFLIHTNLLDYNCTTKWLE